MVLNLIELCEKGGAGHSRGQPKIGLDNQGGEDRVLAPKGGLDGEGEEDQDRVLTSKDRQALVEIATEKATSAAMGQVAVLWYPFNLCLSFFPF